MVNIGGNILELSETNFMNLPAYVFDVDYVAKIRSGLSITVLEKKIHKTTALKSDSKVILCDPWHQPFKRLRHPVKTVLNSVARSAQNNHKRFIFYSSSQFIKL